MYGETHEHTDTVSFGRHGADNTLLTPYRVKPTGFILVDEPIVLYKHRIVASHSTYTNWVRPEKSNMETEKENSSKPSHAHETATPKIKQTHA